MTKEEELQAEIVKLKETLEEKRVKYNIINDACKEMCLATLELVKVFKGYNPPRSVEEPLQKCLNTLTRVKGMTNRLKEFDNG